ncbi:MAG TPA: hypothetical protein VNX02_05775 [Steroidobacteraceae bacterium]|jgi:hypothetical protein|nr:hypothetical protein [Steroidobacteraceae bacterium]
MVTAVGSSPVPSLQGQIRQDQVQLNDWTTCVSAKTPKGQAAIQKLSGEISAATEQIARALQNQSGTASPSAKATPAPGRASRPGSLDVWA